MQEALLLFESLMSLTWFKSSLVVLFLTKLDLFEKKLPHSPVSKYFPDYTGSDTDSESAREFFISKFLSMNRVQGRTIHVLCVDATNTDHVRKELRKLEVLLSSHVRGEAVETQHDLEPSEIGQEDLDPHDVGQEDLDPWKMEQQDWDPWKIR